MSESAAHETLQVLAAAPIFQGMDPHDLEELASTARPFHLSAHEVLFSQGDPGENVYFIGSGKVEVLSSVPGSSDYQLSVSGPGAIIGELALLEGETRSATVKALEETSGVMIGRHGFDALRLGTTQPCMAMMRRLCSHVAAELRAVYRQLVEQLVKEAAGETEFHMPDLPAEITSPVLTTGFSESEIEFLNQIPFFSGFDSDELCQVLEGAERVMLPVGKLITAPDKPLDSLYVVMHGAIAASLSHGGRVQRVRLAGPGSTAVLLSLVDDQVNPLTCITKERTEAVVFSRAYFDALFNGHSAVSQRFIAAIQTDLVRTLRDAIRAPAWMFISEKSQT